MGSYSVTKLRKNTDAVEFHQESHHVSSEIVSTRLCRHHQQCLGRICRSFPSTRMSCCALALATLITTHTHTHTSAHIAASVLAYCCWMSWMVRADFPTPPAVRGEGAVTGTSACVRVSKSVKQRLCMSRERGEVLSEAMLKQAKEDHHGCQQREQTHTHTHTHNKKKLPLYPNPHRALPLAVLC